MPNNGRMMKEEDYEKDGLLRQGSKRQGGGSSDGADGGLEGDSEDAGGGGGGGEEGSFCNSLIWFNSEDRPMMPPPCLAQFLR